MMEDANEIQEAMGRSYGTPDVDEDDLAAGKGIDQYYYIKLTIPYWQGDGFSLVQLFVTFYFKAANWLSE